MKDDDNKQPIPSESEDGKSGIMPIKNKDDLLLTQQLLDIVKMLQSQELTRAREVLLPLLSEHSKDYRLWHLAGIIASQAGHHEQAVIYLKQAHQLAPKQVEPILNLARVYTLQKQTNLAASCYLKVLEFDKNNEAALRGFSIILMNAGKYQKAEEFINHWLSLRKNNDAYQLLVQVKLAQKQHDQVLSIYEAMQQLQPNNINIAMQIANFHTMIGEYTEAISHYLSLLDKDKNNIDVLRQLAFTYYLNRDLKLAVDLFNKVLVQIPDDFPSLNNLSCVYKDLGEYQKAKQALLKLLDSKQVNAGIYVNLANACMYLKEYKTAESYYQEAKALDNDSLPIMQLYASSLIKQGQYNKGWPLFTKAYVSLDKYNISLPEWDGQESKKAHLLLIADGNKKDIVLLSRFITSLQKFVKKVYVYHPDENIRVWFNRCFKDIKLVTSLESLPQKISTYTSLLSLPELLQLTDSDIIRKQTYLATKAKVQTQSILVSLSPTILNKTEYQEWINTLTKTYKKVYVVSQKEIHELSKQIEYIDPVVDLVELTQCVGKMAHIITSDNIIAHLAGAQAKPCTVVIEPNMDWYWPVEGVASVWYPSCNLKLFGQDDFR